MCVNSHGESVRMVVLAFALKQCSKFVVSALHMVVVKVERSINCAHVLLKMIEAGSS